MKNDSCGFELDGHIYFIETDENGVVKRSEIDGKVVLDLLAMCLENEIHRQVNNEHNLKDNVHQHRETSSEPVE